MGSGLTSEEIVETIKPHILQHHNEGVWFLEKVGALNPKSILEIGCCGGGLTSLLATTGATVTTVDILKSKIYVWEMERFLEICPAPKIELVIGDSNSFEVYRKVKGEYDLVVIDGAHDWRTEYNDWSLYSPLTNVIAIHDIVEYESKHGGDWDWFPTEFWWEIKNGPSKRKIKLDYEYKTDEFVDVLSGGWGIIYKL